MKFVCPRCDSSRIVDRYQGRSVCGSVGIVAGSAGGAAGAWSGSQVGARIF